MNTHVLNVLAEDAAESAEKWKVIRKYRYLFRIVEEGYFTKLENLVIFQ